MAYSATTFVRGPETTEEGFLDTNLSPMPARRVRDVSSRIAYLDPDSAPYTLLVTKSASKVAVNPRFEWIEKTLPSRWDAIASSITNENTISSGQSTWVVRNQIFNVGDLILVPRTGEFVRVVSGSGLSGAASASPPTITVARDVTNIVSGGATIDASDDLLITGTSFAEGSGAPQPKTWNESNPYNYTQIFKTAFSVTGSEENSELYTGRDRPRMRLENGVQHKLDIERQGLFGSRFLDNSDTSNVRRYTGGFFYYTGASSNIIDAGGTLTEPEMENWLQGVFQHVGATDTRALMCAPKVISVLDSIAIARLETVPEDESFGLTMRQWVTSHGVVNVLKHRLLENSPTGYNSSPSGYGNYAIAVDPTHVVYRFLANRNTVLQTDIQAPDFDGWEDQYMTECGWQVELPDVHGQLKNVLQ